MYAWLSLLMLAALTIERSATHNPSARGRLALLPPPIDLLLTPFLAESISSSDVWSLVLHIRKRSSKQFVTAITCNSRKRS
jgi:hypothetical protein